MKCPLCHVEARAEVVDVRLVKQGIRRRRECSACEGRYSTVERVVVVRCHDCHKQPRKKRSRCDGCAEIHRIKNRAGEGRTVAA